LINIDGSETTISPGAVITLDVLQQRRLRVVFNPAIPAVAARTSGLSSTQALPERVTSSLTFTQAGGQPVVINLIGRVSEEMRFINEQDPTRPPEVQFSRSGNEFILVYSIYDPDMDVTRARYEPLTSSGQLVGSALEVDLGQALQQVNLVRGQSFTVEQRFTGANSNPDVASIRVTVRDGEGDIIATSSLAATSASASGLRSEQGGRRLRVLLRASLKMKEKQL
jgi:hypothetical protein